MKDPYLPVYMTCIDELETKWEIVPQFIQVEAHTYFTQKELRKTLDKNERYYHRTDEQLVQFAGWRPTFEKA